MSVTFTEMPDAIASDLFPNPWLDLVCDGYELPFRDRAIAHLILFDVFHHLEKPALFLREARRVLAPGGLALVWEFGPTGHPVLDAWNAAVVSRGVRGPRLRSSDTLRRLATEAGFPFTRYANLRPFLVPPIPRASILIGRPPEGFDSTRL